jgi:hypothetical protein
MTIRNLFLCAALVVSAAACKSKEEGAVEEMISMMEAMGNAIESAGDDCGKMAANLEAVGKKYDLAKIKKNVEGIKGDEKQAEEMMKKYAPRMEKAMPKMMGAMKCSDDPKMKEVQAKFDGMM